MHCSWLTLLAMRDQLRKIASVGMAVGVAVLCVWLVASFAGLIALGSWMLWTAVIVLALSAIRALLGGAGWGNHRPDRAPFPEWLATRRGSTKRKE